MVIPAEFSRQLLRKPIIYQEREVGREGDVSNKLYFDSAVFGIFGRCVQKTVGNEHLVF